MSRYGGNLAQGRRTVLVARRGKKRALTSSFPYNRRVELTRVLWTSHMTEMEGSTFASSGGEAVSRRSGCARRTQRTFDSNDGGHEAHFRTLVLSGSFNSHEL